MIRFTADEFEKLVSYVGGRYGIDLSKKQTLAECRLCSELEKRQIPTLTEFLRRVQADRTGRLAAVMMNRLTTNYTFFYREQSHFDFLEQRLLPQLPAGMESFRVWCAGCSTGEECYTLAMALSAYRDRGGWLPPVQILATDLSEPALQKAEAARYSAKALEPLPEAWRRVYCRMDGPDAFTVRADVRGMVSFRKMNLMRPYAGHGRYDLILCRNVMIYFSDPARRNLTERLGKSLKRGGYLFIGHTELLPQDQSVFTYICPAIYQKAKENGYEEGLYPIDGGVG